MKNTLEWGAVPAVATATETLGGVGTALSHDLQQKLIAEIFDDAKALALRKNKDYGGSVFSVPILAPGMSVDAAIRVRMSDKINRLTYLLAGNAPQVDESLADTIKDLGTYCFVWLICKRIESAAPPAQSLCDSCATRHADRCLVGPVSGVDVCSEYRRVE